MKKKRAKEVYSLADLRKWDSIDPPVRLAVLGIRWRIRFSPQMPERRLKDMQDRHAYARFQISPTRKRARLIRELNFVGGDLTTPHKIAASKLMDEIDDDNVSARLIPSEIDNA
jgi:shikimate 5-dehydrogenase